MPAFDKKIRESRPRTLSMKETVEVWYPSWTDCTVGGQRFSLEDLVGTQGPEWRSGAQSHLGQAPLNSQNYDDDEASDSDMLVDLSRS